MNGRKVARNLANVCTKCAQSFAVKIDAQGAPETQKKRVKNAISATSGFHNRKRQEAAGFLWKYGGMVASGMGTGFLPYLTEVLRGPRFGAMLGSLGASSFVRRWIKVGRFFFNCRFLWYHIGYQVKQRALIVDIDFLGYC